MIVHRPADIVAQQVTAHDRRRFLKFLAGGSAIIALPACAEAPERSPRPLLRPAQPADSIVARADLGGQLAYAVMDLANGNLLEGRSANTALPPASVAKAITALYGLDHLGGDFRFRTRLLATGPVQAGVLEGDLILAGGGDPTLDTDALAGLVAGLVRGGVQRVRGRFLVWGGALPFVDQIADDQSVQAGYNAAVSGLNLNFNRVHFEWRRTGSDYSVTMDARSDRHRPEVRMARMQVVDRGAPLYTLRTTDGQDRWTVARGALGNTGSRWLPVRLPELYAGEVFVVLAAAQGLRLPQPEVLRSVPSGVTLLEHNSVPLVQLLTDTLRFSTNISAEAVGLAASQAAGGAPANLAASGALMSDWARARFGMTSLRMVDHSGLGAASRVSMVDLCSMFRQAGQSSGLRDLLRVHPFRDARGRTISNPGLDVRAKTGTLFFVSALGGYLRTTGGRELAFAICSADLGRRASVVSGDLDRPDGTATWNGQARNMQQDLLYRWAQAYATG